MRILIVGNGGREHAFLWKLHRDHPEHDYLFTAGNAGILRGEGQWEEEGGEQNRENSSQESTLSLRHRNCNHVGKC